MQNPENQILVIFGASGDLARRKLIPSLFNLLKQKSLPAKFAVLGVGRTDMSSDAFRDSMKEALAGVSGDKSRTDKLLQDFLSHLHYLSIDTYKQDDYSILRDRLSELEEIYDTRNCIYYLSTPPGLYATVARNLGSAGLHRQEEGKAWKRIIVEKPFGNDLKSSRELNINLLSIFEEEQVYRIDHYLGKETVQNIMVTRFSNGIFEPLWNRNYIHHVEITSAENIGVENRGGYYDQSGALRDMFQNHMLQLVGLVAMEPPVWADSQSIRNEIVKVFESFRPMTEKNIEQDVIRGQYTESLVRGTNIPGYRQEKGIPQDSRTETYLAVKFYIDNWRWSGIPFYVRTGKRLPTRVTEIVIHFHPTPHHIFSRQEEGRDGFNQLIIRIQPDEGLLIKFGMKVPGAGYQVQNVNMDFHYSDLSEVYLPTAYERLLLDCMLGDSTLYARGDAVESAWRFVNPILENWQDKGGSSLYGYPAGSWGPETADNLIEGEHLSWRYPCKNLAEDGIYCEL